MGYPTSREELLPFLAEAFMAGAYLRSENPSCSIGEGNHACLERVAEILNRIDASGSVSNQGKMTAPVGSAVHHGLDDDRRVCFYEQDYYCLSSFSAFSILWSGKRFDTLEHLYHYLKFDPHHPEACRAIHEAPSAHAAFRLSRELQGLKRADWDGIKIGVMRRLIRTKVDQHEYVRRKLLDTGDRVLVENSWRDGFWGWGPDERGQNVLGELWMELRAELRRAEGLRAVLRRAEGGSPQIFGSTAPGSAQEIPAPPQGGSSPSNETLRIIADESSHWPDLSSPTDPRIRQIAQVMLAERAARSAVDAQAKREINRLIKEVGKMSRIAHAADAWVDDPAKGLGSQREQALVEAVAEYNGWLGWRGTSAPTTSRSPGQDASQPTLGNRAPSSWREALQLSRTHFFRWNGVISHHLRVLDQEIVRAPTTTSEESIALGLALCSLEGGTPIHERVSSMIERVATSTTDAKLAEATRALLDACRTPSARPPQGRQGGPRRRNFVRFYWPPRGGVGFAEDATVEFGHWDVQDAVKVSRVVKNPHGDPGGPSWFSFSSVISHDPIPDGEGGTLEVRSATVGESGRFYLGGSILTYEEVTQIHLTDQRTWSPILDNMRNSGQWIICVAADSLVSVFGHSDVVVDPLSGEVVERGDDPARVAYRAKMLERYAHESQKIDPGKIE